MAVYRISGVGLLDLFFVYLIQSMTIFHHDISSASPLCLFFDVMKCSRYRDIVSIRDAGNHRQRFF
jgi:hypothetical protein